MATVPGVIVNIVSRHNGPSIGRAPPTASGPLTRPLHVPGPHLLEYQVQCGRERLKRSLDRSNYPTTSYNMGVATSVGMGPRSLPASVAGRVDAEREASPRYDWQITYDKYPRDVTLFREIEEETHNIPRFGKSELQGASGKVGPVARFNLADEYHTNTARGFKFVRGARPASPSSSILRAESAGTNGNTRIGTFRRGEHFFLPDSTATDYTTRDLTQIWGSFPYKIENCLGSRSGLMATATAGSATNNY
eukprot:Tamp_18999.p1 GENE.Tamp_18999~~Tamp_18999.p1  ORF type:complete len:250 (+),score=19.86 Tamp_18999:194-943(+)